MSGSASLTWLFDRMAEAKEREAIIWRDQTYSYHDLLELVSHATRALDAYGLPPGRVVSLEADSSPSAVAMLLALIDRKAILVPLTGALHRQHDDFLHTAEVQDRVIIDPSDNWHLSLRGAAPQNLLTRRLIDTGDPGLVLFSSGSTGKNKAVLHNMTALLEKFKVSRHTLRTLIFLLLDHIGGQNTLYYILSNCGTIISIDSRDPDAVCAAIEQHRVELLPTSPTFLNLLLISEAFKRYDLSSLKRITYGTEVMPASTLMRVHQTLPDVELLQTYGLSELGILRSKSRDSSSLWLKVGGEGFETKIVEGILWIRAASAMLGYLNHPSPFDAAGWFNTGDSVEVDDEWIRILGRESEIINVGGQKVYPAEVESVLLQMENIKDVVVRGERSAIIGNMVVARVNLFQTEDVAALTRRVRAFCRDKLAPFKIPVKVDILDGDQFSPRFKKLRKSSEEGPALWAGT